MPTPCDYCGGPCAACFNCEIALCDADERYYDDRRVKTPCRSADELIALLGWKVEA